MHQMVQEGAVWSSVMITLGPCWCKVNLNWDNIAIMVVALSDAGSHINIIMAQLKLYWLSYSLN